MSQTGKNYTVGQVDFKLNCPIGQHGYAYTFYSCTISIGLHDTNVQVYLHTNNVAAYFKTLPIDAQEWYLEGNKSYSGF